MNQKERSAAYKRPLASARKIYNKRKFEGIAGQITKWLDKCHKEKTAEPQCIFAYIDAGEPVIVGNSSFVKTFKENNLLHGLFEKSMMESSTNNAPCQIVSREAEDEVVDTFTRFLECHKVTNHYKRSLISNAARNGKKIKHFWKIPENQPVWWPIEIPFTSPNYRIEDGDDVHLLSATEIETIADSLRSFIKENSEVEISIAGDPEFADADEIGPMDDGFPIFNDTGKDEEIPQKQAKADPETPMGDAKTSNAQETPRTQQDLLIKNQVKACILALKAPLQRNDWELFSRIAQRQDQEFDMLTKIQCLIEALGECAYYRGLKDKRYDKRLLKLVPEGFIPGYSTGDGNCMYNSICRLLTLPEDYAAMLRFGSILFSIAHMHHLTRELTNSLPNIQLASAFLAQQCSDYAYENRPGHEASIEEIIQSTLRFETMATSKDKDWAGTLQLRLLAGLLQRPIIMVSESDLDSGYAGRVNPCSCLPTNEYGPSLMIMWTTVGNSGRINHVIPVYSKQASRSGVEMDKFIFARPCNTLCAAQHYGLCQLSHGEDLDWMQCCRCCMWFHGVCCGLKSSSHIEFICCPDSDENLRCNSLFCWPEGEKGINISAKDITLTLVKGLTSAAMELYVRYLQVESLKQEMIDIFVATDATYQLLQRLRTEDATARFHATAHVDVNNQRLLLFPCSLMPDAWHYVLVVASPKDKWYAVLDPYVATQEDRTIKELKTRFRNFLDSIVQKSPTSMENFQIFAARVPQQNPGSVDCGAMVLSFIRSIAEGRYILDVSQNTLILDNSYDAAEIRGEMLRLMYKLQ